MALTDCSPVLDMDQLRNITMEDETLMREIVTALVHDAGNQIDKLRDAVHRGSAPEAAKLAHSARGACGNVGASTLASLFSAIETHASAGDLGGCVNEVQSLSTELDKLRDTAQSF
jgi:HPt (histidine-containing phosphotransfer) domain-containing protein